MNNYMRQWRFYSVNNMKESDFILTTLMAHIPITFQILFWITENYYQLPSNQFYLDI